MLWDPGTFPRRQTVGMTLFLASVFISMSVYQAHSAPCNESIDKMINWLQTRPHSKNDQRSIRSITSRLTMRHGTRSGAVGIASYGTTKLNVVDKILRSDPSYRTYFSDRGFFRHSRTKIETLSLSKQSIRRFDNALGLEMDYRAVHCFPSDGLPIFIIAISEGQEREILTMVLLYDQASKKLR